jgi:hypothetical protein
MDPDYPAAPADERVAMHLRAGYPDQETPPMVAFLFVLWLLDVARADRPSLEQQVPADLTRALESTELLGSADLADLGTRAVADLKTIEADIAATRAKNTRTGVRISRFFDPRKESIAKPR